MDIVDLLDWAISHGGGITEARAEDITRESLSMEKGRVKSVSSSERIGFGVRVLLDGCIGYACTTRLSKDSVKNAVECAIHLARASKPTENPLSREERTPIQAKAELRVMRDHGKATLEDKLSLLRRTHESAMEHGKDIKTVNVYYGAISGSKWFKSSDGGNVICDLFRTALTASVVSKGVTGLADGGDGHGGTFNLFSFKGKHSPEEIGKNASQWAAEKLEAKSCPVGKSRTLLHPTLTGTLAHEAFGHMCEADSIIAGESILKEKIGQQLGSAKATIIDEGTPDSALTEYPGMYIPYDDEGTPTQRTLILDHGILSNYLHSRETAHQLHVNPTGNARSVSYKYEPICRMRNTYFAPGDLSLNEALSELGTGIYAIGTGGGQSGGDGTFLFKARRGYVVKDGEISYPIKDVALMGNILNLLKGVEGATRELEIETGGCGKGGQFPLPVGTGGPHLLLSEAMFGGE